MELAKFKEMGKSDPPMLSLVRTMRASSLPGRTPPFYPGRESTSFRRDPLLALAHWF